MAKTATHMGTCQLCGHFQKLPGGKLSLHGYTKQWGFFSGTCPGSRHNPFETHTDRIEQAIAEHLASAQALRASADALEASDEMWVNHYVAPTWQNRKGGYRWLRVDSFTYTNNRLTVVSGGETIELGYIAARGAYSPDELWTKSRGALAASRRAMAANHDAYVTWQRERVAAWQPKPLAEV